MAYRHTSGNTNGSGGGGLNKSPQNHSMHEYSGDERESQRSGGVNDRSSIINLQNKPTYLLEHLATFTVNKESGILYPADGMRRLLQLEKTTGIWSQKMQLCLDYPWVLIMDYETENIIEKFPATLIQEPTAFTSTDAMELYNNILVFIVSSGGSSSGARSEMHIFQSQNVSAVNLVEDLKQLRNGKNIIKQHNMQQQQQQQQQHGSHNMLVQHKSHSVGMAGMISGITSGSGGGGGGVGGGDTDSERGDITVVGLNGLNDETSSTSSDKYERDVTVLNHCFDDIEKFIARLQHAAAALRELERRRRNRKSKKKDIGEGLLTLRTRPPHEKEFMDIFAKFKLSFNLLAKLKSHIHDPNAPELVHFLFTPLALIVEASNDTYYEAQLPAHVINPLLTREAINLLINCVTSKETELWRSLGDAWTVPRDQWKDDNNIGITYHPVFMDGWSPDYLVIDELEQQHQQQQQQHSSSSPPTPTQMSPLSNASFKKRIAAAAASSANNDNHFRQQQQQQHYHNQHQAQDEHINGHDFNALDNFAVYGDNNQHMPTTTAITGIGGNGAYDFSTRSKMSMDSIEHEPHDLPLATTSAAAAATTTTAGAAVNLTTTRNNEKIGISAINAITSGMQNMQTFYDGTIKNESKINHNNNNNNNHNNEQYSGIDDQQHLHHHHHHHQQQHSNNNNNNNIITAWLDELQANNAKIVLVTYPRTANNDKELSVVRGEYLEVLDDTRKWWKARNIRGQVAHVPHTIVTPYNYDDRTDAISPPTHFKSNYNNHNNNKINHANNDQMKDSLNNSQIGAMSGDNSQWNRNKHLGKKGEFRYF